MKNIYFGTFLLFVSRLLWVFTPPTGATFPSFLIGSQLWLTDLIGIVLIVWQLTVSLRKK